MSRFGRALCWGIPLLVGFALAGSWAISGGFFAPGHDAYGKVAIPGELTVTLPAGPARLYVQEHGYFGKGRSATIPRGWAPVAPWLFGLGILAVALVIGFIDDQIRKRIDDRTAG